MKAATVVAVLALAFFFCYFPQEGRAAQLPVDQLPTPICWGSNNYNQSTVPDFTLSVIAFSQLSAGVQTTCGLDKDRILCWGDSSSGQGGSVEGIYSDVSVGLHHMCAISTYNKWTDCWGANDNAQLAVPAGAAFQTLSAGWYHTCGILSNGSVLCWGALGAMDFGQASVPTREPFAQIAAGAYHTCGLLKNSSAGILCWGSNATGQLAFPKSASGWIRVGAGEAFSCGLLDDGSVRCWGDNTDGQLNVPGTNLESFDEILVGGNYACAVGINSKQLRCWGSNSTGQLGVPTGVKLSAITAGDRHMCAMASKSTSTSPSPTPLPSERPPSPSTEGLTFVPITANVTAKFGADAPLVSLGASSSSSAGGSSSDLSVRSELSQLQFDNTTLTGVRWTVSNSTSSSSGVQHYAAVLPDNATSLTQSYAFFPQAQAMQFNGIEFATSPGSVKWSINITRSSDKSSSSSAAAAGPLQFVFRLSTNASRALTGEASRVRMFTDWPREHMTTYWVPSGYADVAIEVQLFDIALVDGAVGAVNHSIVQRDDGETTAFDLVLSFPRFNKTLEYDPSIGLGVLLGGGATGSDGGTSSDNTGVIVGVAVAVPVAVVLVLVAVAVGTVLAVRKRSKSRTVIADRLHRAAAAFEV